ncbi:hypothetical protein Plim_4182 [Planctopirus limnophila DSM 3776]|uniref:Uncharacterized protein n=1 Tax=Planctopirus limnophila (strain ATCC 43296 / DSM 3776 / IFAM 1008 / Mu 290) TaxID=521674 RepID=D5SZ90_PLAL2|nr:hypothetical protein [Planctopirus limnophila]ADG69991.1 hypothetical protein Plim_4182 [Planctopirus limnophila DSM 3776]
MAQSNQNIEVVFEDDQRTELVRLVRSGTASACHPYKPSISMLASARDDFVVEDEYWKLIANQRC